MTDEHTLHQDLRHPQSILSTWIGVVLLFFVFGLFVWVVIGASRRGDTYEAKRATARVEKLKTLREEENKALTTYGWVDKTKGIARVPIDRAMELTLADLATKKPAPANPIATPEPQAPTAPAPAAGAPAPAPQPAGSPTPKPVSVEGPGSVSGTQPAAIVSPIPAPPGTQPGALATPAAGPGAPSAQAPQSPTPIPVSPPASPLPVRGKTPP